jgi:hypothetical protein
MLDAPFFVRRTCPITAPVLTANVKLYIPKYFKTKKETIKLRIKGKAILATGRGDP